MCVCVCVHVRLCARVCVWLQSLSLTNTDHLERQMSSFKDICSCIISCVSYVPLYISQASWKILSQTWSFTCRPNCLGPSHSCSPLLRCTTYANACLVRQVKGKSSLISASLFIIPLLSTLLPLTLDVTLRQSEESLIEDSYRRLPLRDCVRSSLCTVANPIHTYLHCLLFISYPCVSIEFMDRNRPIV